MESFRAWKVGAPFYLPLLLGGIGLIFGFDAPLFWIFGAILFALGLFTLNFFRDPKRVVPSETTAVVSPADGKVVAVDELSESPHYDGPCKCVAIFLNVFDVHVNRAPYDGQVTFREHQPGRFVNAMSPEASELNEAVTLKLDTPAGPMTVRQVAGLVARRIVCLPVVSNTVVKGQRIGMIKFGSRTELYMPVSCSVRVQVGDMVKGASTILADAPPAETGMEHTNQ